MFGVKKKVASFACGLAFLLACIGSGFGSWYFMSSTSKTNLETKVVITNSDFKANKSNLTETMISNSILIENSESENDLTGIAIRVQGKYYTEDNQLTSLDFSADCLLSSVNQGNNLGEFIEMTNVKECETPTDSDSNFNSLVAPEEKIGTFENNLVSFTVDLSNTKYDVNNQAYDIDICVFPCFDYLENKKPTSFRDYFDLRTMVSNTNFSFGIDLAK